MKLATNSHKTRIHIAKAELNLSQEEYEAYLAPYGVTSSKNLKYQEAEELLETFKKQGWKPKPRRKPKPNPGRTDKGWGAEKYEYLRPRPSEMADPVQLRLAEVLWRIVARDPSDEALENFLLRQTKTRKLEWLRKKNICAVLCALQKMYEKCSTEHINDRQSLLEPWQQDLIRSNLNAIIYMK